MTLARPAAVPYHSSLPTTLLIHADGAPLSPISPPLLFSSPFPPITHPLSLPSPPPVWCNLKSEVKLHYSILVAANTETSSQDSAKKSTNQQSAEKSASNKMAPNAAESNQASRNGTQNDPQTQAGPSGTHTAHSGDITEEATQLAGQDSLGRAISTGMITYIPPFTGKSDSDINDFLSTVEEISILSGWSNVQRCAIARLRMQQPARDFLSVETRLMTCDWEEFKTLLRRRFERKEYSMSNLQKLNDCTQGVKETVQEYATKLRLLGRKCIKLGDNPEENKMKLAIMEETTLGIFLKGLKGSLRRFVATHDPKTLAEAIVIAEREENIALCSSYQNA